MALRDDGSEIPRPLDLGSLQGIGVDWRKHARDKPAAALRVTNDIFELVESLAQFPLLGAVYPYCPEARHVTCHNYVIYYVLKENEVVIRAIAHGARKFRRGWLRRR